MAIWTLDKAHTEVKFKVRHLVVSSVAGTFDDFSGSITSTGDDFSTSKVVFEADVNSINTKNEMRDGHLKSADFFDSANHPKLTFVSKSIEKKSDDEYVVTGDMTIRGTTKEVALKAIYNGQSVGFGGSIVAGFELSGKLNRMDYGLHWNALTEAGGVAVGDEVKLSIDAELIKQSEAAEPATVSNEKELVAQ
ncbi:MAG TPA: YceI family protein [Candidatus Kapabacteria bacterium]|nr:YceI family protein [Candidatus Kapabacteria bacterium]